MIPIQYMGKNDWVDIRCKRTGKLMTLNCSLEVFEKGLEKYKRGAMMQDAFPFLSADEREFLISGTTPEEWAEMFGNAED